MSVAGGNRSHACRQAVGFRSLKQPVLYAGPGPLVSTHMATALSSRTSSTRMAASGSRNRVGGWPRGGGCCRGWSARLAMGAPEVADSVGERYAGASASADTEPSCPKQPTRSAPPPAPSGPSPSRASRTAQTSITLPFRPGQGLDAVASSASRGALPRSAWAPSCRVQSATPASRSVRASGRTCSGQRH